MRVIGLRALFVLSILIIIIVPAAVVTARPRSTGRIAHIGGAQYSGVCTRELCKWHGLQYAAAPVGKLRFARPQPPAPATGHIDATKKGNICPQSSSDVLGQSEDCLNLDIYAPKLIKTSEKLPVLIFFHGGGFQAGSSGMLSAEDMVALGSRNGLPTLVLSANYRLGLLGFLGGSEMLKRQGVDGNDVSLNNGFHDMSQAIKWVKENIAAFGGDPARITIWGQSAGSFGVAAQLLKYPDQPPFQGAILESGSPGGVPVDLAATHDDQFKNVLTKTECDKAKDAIDCLRNVDWKTLNKISMDEASTDGIETIPRGFYAWTPMVDDGPAKGGFYTGKPSDAINAKAYANVPLLHGDCLDEGTAFVTHAINSEKTAAEYIKRIYFDGKDADNLVNEVLKAYPDDPTVGSPYEPVKEPKTERFFGANNQFKRLSSIYGDIRYQANRRFFLTAAAQRGIPVYSYIFAQDTPGTPPYQGVPHGSDMDYFTAQQRRDPFKGKLALQWLAFATSADPSKGKGLPQWPKYTADARQLLYYSGNKITAAADKFREEAIALLNRPDILQSTSR